MISKLNPRYNTVYKLINYYIMNGEYTSMNNVISNNRINCLTLGQTHLTSLSEQSLTSTANIRQSVIGCQPSSSMGVNGAQLEIVYSFTR